MMLSRCGAVLLLVAGMFVRADDKVSPKQPLKLTLTIKEKIVKVGEIPVFVLAIENRGTQPERLLNGKRTRLQPTWYSPTITQNDNRVEMSYRLIGVPLMQDGDIVTLKPNEKIEFELTSFCPVVEDLPPGKYKAQFNFATFPINGNGESYETTKIAFEVKK